jgi:putative ABC transport system permease protein
MFRNHFKTAIRTVVRNKVYSLINFLGLTIGLAACMIVATVVIDDLSYDRQWKNSAQLYRVITVDKKGEGLYNRVAFSFHGVASQLLSDYPEVKAAGSLNNRKERFRLTDTDPNGVEISTLNADTSVWQMLDLGLIAGNSRNYVSGTGNIVLTESFCKQHYPRQNPVGRTIYSVSAYSDKPQPYLITGIVRDLPSNSVFRAEAVVIMKPGNESLTKQMNGTFVPDNYILIRPGTDIRKLETKFNRWYAAFTTVKNPFQYEFQPLKDVYLHSDFAGTQQVKGDIRSIYIFSGIALLVLLIACVNYVNLTISRALQRLPETGVRKVLGAARGQLINQFLTESLLFFLLSAMLSTIIYAVVLSLIQRYLGHPLTITFISQYSLFTLAYLAIFLISLLSGIYPAWVLSGFKPAAVLKGKLSFNRFGGQQLIRKGLVAFQFTISIVVLVALIVVRQQVSYMKGKDIGFDKNNLLDIGFINWDRKGGAFKNELLRQPGIVSASITPWYPSGGAFMMTNIEDPGHPGNRLEIDHLIGDIDLTRTLGLKVEKGRLLDKSFAADQVDEDSIMRITDSATYVGEASRQSSVITDYTAKALGIQSLNTPIKGALTTPVGIVKDFYRESLRTPLSPTIIIADRSPAYGGMLVRVAPGYEQQAREYIAKQWRKFFPDKLLEMKWVNDMVNDQYKKEATLQQLFAFFSGLSMFLAALGILGLIIHATEQRRKEIGIRKVLGATVASIVRLFSVDFLKLILLALVVATPVAWWLMSRWLTDFAYRTRVSPWMFGVAGMTTVAIALITIGLQAAKAALDNPIKSLRTE